MDWDLTGKCGLPAVIRLNDIIDEVKTYHANADIELIQKAYVYIAKNYQGTVRVTGEPYLSHPLEVAYILSQMRLDVLAITAGLVHDVTEYTNAEIKDIAGIFGSEVGAIVDGVTKISQLGIHQKQSRQAEAVRKMIVAMATDIRVLLVQIADRLHTMRTLGDMDEKKQQLIARETLKFTRLWPDDLVCMVKNQSWRTWRFSIWSMINTEKFETVLL